MLPMNVSAKTTNMLKHIILSCDSAVFNAPVRAKKKKIKFWFKVSVSLHESQVR